MEPVRTGLRNIASELLRKLPVEQAVILAWPMVCGKEVAARTEAVAFAEGSLTVAVREAAWRGQLASFAPRYISSFAELLGPLVREIKFVGKHSGLSIQPTQK